MIDMNVLDLSYLRLVEGAAAIDVVCRVFRYRHRRGHGGRLLTIHL